MSDTASPLEIARRGYEPRVPDVLRRAGVRAEERETPLPADDVEAIRERFPHTFGRPRVELVADDAAPFSGALRVGVVLSGGQAPGGHNVLCGLLDGLLAIDRGGVLIGFLDGPGGILADRTRNLDEATLEPYRNTGGFDCIGSGRDKIETPEQLARSAETCRARRLDGLVVVGGDDSNTNAAVLAEHFLARDVPTRVVGVPKTIDGDLKNEHVEQSFGFDTATKVYAELVGNIARDAASARKYWHFVKLMGRSASHVTLECALATRPDVALIGEEVARDRTTLEALVGGVADVVARRSAAGRDYGVCLVPEGLIEFVPEMRALIDALNRALAGAAGDAGAGEREAAVRDALDRDARRLFDGLPEGFRAQLLLDRDAHGNVQVSKIETEKLLVELVARELRRRENGGRFSTQTHFLGYEGRCAAPSNFDADYTYALGRTAAALLAAGRTGVMAALSGLAGPSTDWRPSGVPITSLFNLEERKGASKPVIRKALVDLEGAPFTDFARHRERSGDREAYVHPGAIQYWGPPEIADARTRTLMLERG